MQFLILCSPFSSSCQPCYSFNHPCYLMLTVKIKPCHVRSFQGVGEKHQLHLYQWDSPMVILVYEMQFYSMYIASAPFCDKSTTRGVSQSSHLKSGGSEGGKRPAAFGSKVRNAEPWEKATRNPLWRRPGKEAWTQTLCVCKCRDSSIHDSSRDEHVLPQSWHFLNGCYYSRFTFTCDLSLILFMMGSRIAGVIPCTASPRHCSGGILPLNFRSRCAPLSSITSPSSKTLRISYKVIFSRVLHRLRQWSLVHVLLFLLIWRRGSATPSYGAYTFPGHSPLHNPEN